MIYFNHLFVFPAEAKIMVILPADLRLAARSVGDEEELSV